MPAYVRKSDDKLVVIFTRDGAEYDRRLALDGSDAIDIAMQMIRQVAALRHGDRLTVTGERS